MWMSQVFLVRISASAMTSSPVLGLRAVWGVEWARAGSGLVVTWTAAVTGGPTGAFWADAAGVTPATVRARVSQASWLPRFLAIMVNPPVTRPPADGKSYPTCRLASWR